MSGRRLMLILLPLALAATALVAWHADRRWESSLIAARVYEDSIESTVSGRVSRAILIRNLEMLARAEALDRSNVTLPLMRGSQHLLMGDPQAALRAYEGALTLEPRAELYLNIGRAHRMAGDEEAAAVAFTNAVRLDRRLRQELQSFFERRRRTAGRARDRDKP